MWSDVSFSVTSLFIVAQKYPCSAPKSGAGLRIEYKFINQSKQCIEKSLTNQNKCTKSWCSLVHESLNQLSIINNVSNNLEPIRKIQIQNNRLKKHQKPKLLCLNIRWMLWNQKESNAGKRKKNNYYRLKSRRKNLKRCHK